MRISPLSSLASPKPQPVITGSEEQQAIWSALMKGDRHVLINAVAGSGKSTTCVEAARRIHASSPGTRVTYLAFNKTIEAEMNERAADLMKTQTFHALGLAALNRRFGNVKVNTNRMWKVIEYMRDWGPGESSLFAGIKQLSALAKQYDLQSKPDLERLVDLHNLDLGSPQEEADVIGLVPLALEHASHYTYGQEVEVDYDDMCWLPRLLRLELPRADLCLVDEAQDLNAVQQWMAVESGERLAIAGDRHQAIYGFRGADIRSMNALSERLAFSSALPVVEYPLSMTRRCPQSHVRLAQQIVPDIKALPDAAEGRAGLTGADSLSEAQPGDMILCRVNAPLVRCAHRLLMEGKPAAIRGKDLQAGMDRLLDRAVSFGDGSLRDTLQQAHRLTQEKVQRLLALTNGRGQTRATIAEDQLQCLYHAAKGCSSLSQLRMKLMTMFQDGDAGQIVLGTIHKLKGMESNRVWLLESGNMPHPMARAEHEIQQEMNCLYVALTRSKDELLFVDGNPAILEGLLE